MSAFLNAPKRKWGQASDPHFLSFMFYGYLRFMVIRSLWLQEDSISWLLMRDKNRI